VNEDQLKMKEKRKNENKDKNKNVKTSLLITSKEVKKVMIARKAVFIAYPMKCLKIV